MIVESELKNNSMKKLSKEKIIEEEKENRKQFGIEDD